MWGSVNDIFDSLFFRLLPKVSLIICGIVLLSMFLYPVTPQYVDNLFYINSSRNIFEDFIYMSGLGEFHPTWPIFYSGMLSIFSVLGEYVSFIARSLNLFFIFLCVCIIFKNKFIKNKKLVITFFLSNFFLFESSMMEMTDVLFTFQSLLFLYICASKKKVRYLGVVIVSLISTMTKTSALIFPASVIGLMILDMIWGSRRISQKNILLFFSSSLGTAIALFINAKIQNYHANDLGVFVNENWSSNNLDWILIELRKAVSFESFSHKFNLFSSFLFPFRVFPGYSTYFVPFGLFIFFKIFKNIFSLLRKGEVCINLSFCIAYGLLMTIIQNIATRHLLILTPFLLSLILEGNLRYRVIKLFLILSFLLNISLSSYFILFGNKKAHFGLINYFNNSVFYKNDFRSLKVIVDRNRDLLIKSDVYTKSNLGRFISFLLQKNITYFYDDIDNLRGLNGSILISPESLITNENRPTLGELVDSESGVSIYKLR